MRAIRLALVGTVMGAAACWPVSAAEPRRPRSLPRPSDRQPIQAAIGASSDTPSNPPAGAPAAPAEPKTETAIFAGGCFWCTELAFEQLAGVIRVESGYCGGSRSTANYDKVHLGSTRHAEAIRITYDPDEITYGDLLNVFFNAHDPTQLNRQGEGDVGRQYRSAIFFENDEQKEQARAKIADLQSRRVYKRRIVTKLEPLKTFYPAENFHQDFARRHPFLPYIQSHAVPRASHIRMMYPELIRTGD